MDVIKLNDDERNDIDRDKFLSIINGITTSFSDNDFLLMVSNGKGISIGLSGLNETELARYILKIIDHSFDVINYEHGSKIEVLNIYKNVMVEMFDKKISELS